MSCGSTGPTGPSSPLGGIGCVAPPCVPPGVAQESTASQIENLTLSLLGQVTKMIVNGRTVWNPQCSPYTTGIPAIPLNSGEGLICYLLRVMSLIGLFSGGVWNAGVTYPAQTLMAYDSALYVALVPNVGNQPDISPAFWALLLTAPTGPQGPQGIPGPSGPPATPAYAIRTTTSNVTLVNTDDVIVFLNSAPVSATVPTGSGLSSGKRFIFKLSTTATAAATITLSGGDTMDSGVTSYTLSVPGESITLVQIGTTGVWIIV